MWAWYRGGCLAAWHPDAVRSVAEAGRTRALRRPIVGGPASPSGPEGTPELVGLRAAIAEHAAAHVVREYAVFEVRVVRRAAPALALPASAPAQCTGTVGVACLLPVVGEAMVVLDGLVLPVMPTNTKTKRYVKGSSSGTKSKSVR